MSQATRERRDRILSELLEQKHVMVRDLATDMDVSEATVRRDLKALADDGRLTLVHGGATLPRDVDFSFQAKHVRNVEAKQAIGAIAAQLIRDGDQVFLDSGTTSLAVASQLREKRGVSVIVNSARLTLELTSQNLNVIMLGGQYRQDRMDFVGPIATSTLEQLRGFRCFIGADGVSMEFGPSAADIESSHLYRLAVANARDTVLLLDHSKFESASLFRIVEWDRISRIVTDQRPDPGWLAFFDQQAIEVLYPERDPADIETTDEHG